MTFPEAHRLPLPPEIDASRAPSPTARLTLAEKLDDLATISIGDRDLTEQLREAIADVEERKGGAA